MRPSNRRGRPSSKSEGGREVFGAGITETKDATKQRQAYSAKQCLALHPYIFSISFTSFSPSSHSHFLVLSLRFFSFRFLYHHSPRHPLPPPTARHNGVRRSPPVFVPTILTFSRFVFTTISLGSRLGDFGYLQPLRPTTQR